MHINVLLKRALRIALCFIIVAVSCVFADHSPTNTVTYATTLSELEKEQKEIQNKINSLKDNVDDEKAKQSAIQDKIKNLQSQIDYCNKQISSLNSQIAKLENEIDEKEAEIADAKMIFRNRLRAIQMSGGNMASLAVLLDTKDFADFLAESELTKKVSEYDNVIIDKIVNEMKVIEEDKTEIEQKKTQQESYQNTLNSKKAELNTQLANSQSSISDLEGQIDSSEDELKKIKVAKADYEKKVAQQATVVITNVSFSGQFAWPVPGYYTITSPYGYRSNPFSSSSSEFHKGIDISGGGVYGAPIIAADDGVVTISGFNSGGYGNYVMINHGSSNGSVFVTLYGHMSSRAVSVGATVKKGQVIGYVGSTGASTGPHLHFEVRVNGSTTNPSSYF